MPSIHMLVRSILLASLLILTDSHAADTPDQWIAVLGDPLHPNFDRTRKELEKIGLQAVPVVGKLMEQPGIKVRIRALEVLEAVIDETEDWKGQESAVATLLGDTLRKDPSTDVREKAAELLENMKGKAVSALPALLAALTDPVDSVSDHAKDALGEMGPAAIPALLEVLPAKPDRKNHTRQMAVEALGDIKGLTLDGLKGMLPLLNEEDADLREETAKSLPSNLSGIPGAVEWLVSVLKEDGQFSSDAAFELGKSRSVGSASALIDAQKSSNPQLRLQAAIALLPIAPQPQDTEAARKLILEALDAADIKVRFAAVDQIELAVRSENEAMRTALSFCTVNLQWLTGDEISSVRDSAKRSLRTFAKGAERVQIAKRTDFQKMPVGWVVPAGAARNIKLPAAAAKPEKPVAPPAAPEF